MDKVVKTTPCRFSNTLTRVFLEEKFQYVKLQNAGAKLERGSVIITTSGKSSFAMERSRRDFLKILKGISPKKFTSPLRCRFIITSVVLP